MKCSIIRRVSTEQQAEKVSLGEQLRLCNESIHARAWQFVKDFNFSATHGKDLKTHPLYLQLRQHIEQNECDVIMVAVLDRALRDTGFWTDLCQLLQEHGKLIATPHQIYNPANTEQELFLNISSAIGHFERKKIRERAKMGLDALKNRGGYTGGTPPYGYTYDIAKKELSIDPAESARLREIFNLIQHYTKVEVCRRLAESGSTSRTGEPWTPRMLRRLLERPRLLFYAGIRTDAIGNEIRATWPAIITESELAQLIQCKKRRTTTYKTEPAYLLTGLGIFRCGYCGLSIKTAANRARKNYKVYYYCSGYLRGHGHCPSSKSIPVQTIDNLVIVDLVKRMKHLDRVFRGFQAYRQKSQVEQRSAKITAELDHLEQKKARLIHAVENDLLNYTEVEKRLNEIRDAIRIKNEELREVHTEEIKVDEATIKAIAEKIDMLPRFRIGGKRYFISNLITKIVLYEKSLHLIYRFPVTESGNREIRIKIQ